MERTISASRPRTPRVGLFDRLMGLMAFDRSLRRLGDLDDHLLRDIGLSREDALRECERPVWHAPDHWLR